MSTRRNFLKQANCAAVGTASIASTLFSLKMMEGAAYAAPPSGYKAMVCLFLAGGNDSYNMLAPKNADAYAEYAAVRGGVGAGGLALDNASELLPITASTAGPTAPGARRASWPRWSSWSTGWG